jgi:hypothetical protein
LRPRGARAVEIRVLIIASARAETGIVYPRRCGRWGWFGVRDEVAGVRRARRVEAVAEEISKFVALGVGNRQVGGFDPNFGASGRPEAVFEIPGSRPAPRRAVARLNKEHHWGEKLEWTGTQLAVEEARLRGRKFTIPIAQIAEVALFASAWGWTPVQRSSDQQTPARIFAGSLHFLDAQGFAVLFVPELECYWHEIIEVTKAAGLPFRAYVLSCPKKNAEEIAKLLFPHRRYCIKIQH